MRRATLEVWCTQHHMASVPQLVAHADRVANRPASTADRAALGVGPGEPLRYRRVELACGTHVLSEAENWYVPARLTPAMNAALERSDIPFGRVIRPLGPSRTTLGVERLWSPLPADWEMTGARHFASRALAIPHALFRHRALVTDARHRPIALVVETYTREILNF